MIRLRRVLTEPKHSPVRAAARQVPVSATRTDAIMQMSFLSLIGNGAVAIRQPAYPSLFGDTISCPHAGRMTGIARYSFTKNGLNLNRFIILRPALE